MDPSEALLMHVQKPEEYPITEETVDGVKYIAFGDNAYHSTARTIAKVYGKEKEYYSLESLVCFLRFKEKHDDYEKKHGEYVKEAAAADVKAVTRIDKNKVTKFLEGEASVFPKPDGFQQEQPRSLKQLLNQGEPDAKRLKLDVPTTSGHPNDIQMEDEGAGPIPQKKEVEIRALNDSLTKDRIAEMRRKRQKNLEKGIVNIDESLSTLTSASLPKCRIHRTRENVMLGVRDLSNVLEIISAAQRQWDLNEKKEKVAAVHAAATIGGRSGLDGQQRSGYSRYAQEAFAHEKTKEIQTEGSFIGSNLSTLKQGHSGGHKPEMRPPPILPSVVQKPSSSGAMGGAKRTSRSPIIIVPSAMNTMINMYNAKDILQGLGYVSVDQKRKESNKKPTDLVIQRQKNGQTYNIRIIDNAEKLAPEDWDRVIGVFVMGVAWQFKGWKWNGNPTDIFTHIPAFHFHFDSDKPVNQVMQWNCQKIPISATKRHMDKARFSQVWEHIEQAVRKNKPHLNQRLGL
ncbi:hypothetical protein GCK72_015822 [Caenorhabditis remanei]|uniref:Cell division control protein 73 C-terminal domain-containing protein n=1 Tax=Caenorhabditis remanei TaxID=31234 RepID=A0A6A5GXJ2_CAERE|nr:hypothetical protein GCK72_015822 [Caenorhabditis remanei]KAF1759356.1 hypothetical protein GCK72_015822 [Caenorhabditis remanei]